MFLILAELSICLLKFWCVEVCFSNSNIALNYHILPTGFVCLRGIDRQTRAPKPLSPRLHLAASHAQKKTSMKVGKKTQHKTASKSWAGFHLLKHGLVAKCVYYGSSTMIHYMLNVEPFLHGIKVTLHTRRKVFCREKETFTNL